jgi:nucleolysin TIA-1/TIAR
MWDMKTGRTRGYGFVAYRDRTDADKAIAKMDGEWLGSRTIRCNWANQKGQPSFAQQQVMATLGIPGTASYNHHPFPSGGMQSYQEVLAQSPPYQTTIYVGNLTPYTTANDIVPLFLNFGQVMETRMQADRGFAFLRLETHEHAASAIVCFFNPDLHVLVKTNYR